MAEAVSYLPVESKVAFIPRNIQDFSPLSMFLLTQLVEQLNRNKDISTHTKIIIIIKFHPFEDNVLR